MFWTYLELSNCALRDGDLSAMSGDLDTAKRHYRMGKFWSVMARHVALDDA